jgi:hypothetical protein
MMKLLRRLFPGKSDEVGTECDRCGWWVTEEFGCPDCRGYVVRVDYPGFVGTYWQPPEDAEGIIWCPICQDEVDASFEWSNARCYAGHEVEIDEPDEGVR